VFRKGQSSNRGDDDTRAMAAAARPARAWELAKSVRLGATCEEVLLAVGAPDCIVTSWTPVDSFSVGSEVWEYDGPESTTRLIWSLPETVRREVTEVPWFLRAIAKVPYWVHDYLPSHIERVEAAPPLWREQARLRAVVS
jgi:hypothetical protein